MPCCGDIGGSGCERHDDDGETKCFDILIVQVQDPIFTPRKPIFEDHEDKMLSISFDMR